MTVIADIGDSSLAGAADLEIHLAHRVLEPGLLHVDGVRGAGGGEGEYGQPWKGASWVIVGDGRFSNDRDGNLDHRSARSSTRSWSCSTTTATRPSRPARELIVQRSCRTGLITKVPDVVGAGLGIEVRTVGQLDAALTTALAHVESFSLINVHIDPYDRSPAGFEPPRPAALQDRHRMRLFVKVPGLLLEPG